MSQTDRALDDRIRISLSGLPSERAQAAQWLSESGTTIDLPEIVEAIDRESVVRIRRSLIRALAAIERRSRTQAIEPPDPDLETLAAMVRHEASPGLGRVRYTARRTLGDHYDHSPLKEAVESLGNRIDGIVTFFDALQTSERTSISLIELVQQSVPHELPPSQFEVDATNEGVLTTEIVSDAGLLSLVLCNALQNSADAVADLNAVHPSVSVRIEESATDFSLTISNPYAGPDFIGTEVVPRGVSTKRDHRGLGLSVAKLAADRLGYAVDIQGDDGLATFRLSGRRR